MLSLLQTIGCDSAFNPFSKDPGVNAGQIGQLDSPPMHPPLSSRFVLALLVALTVATFEVLDASKTPTPTSAHVFAKPQETIHMRNKIKKEWNIDYAKAILKLKLAKNARKEVERAERRAKEAREQMEGAVERLKTAEAAARAEMKLVYSAYASEDSTEGETAAEAEMRQDDGLPQPSSCRPTQLVPAVSGLSAGTIFGADLLENPSHVAIDLEGHILVSDYNLDEVIVFNSKGCAVRRLGSTGQDAAWQPFNGPTGVAVNRQGQIVVADSGNDRIQVFNADGSVARCFGSQGSEPGQLNCPLGLATNIEGHIVVADSYNDRIQVFDENGTFLRQIGSSGDGVGQLSYPHGVAVDKAGRIVVADYLNRRVQVFNGDGSVALCFGTCGDALGQLSGPEGVAVDSEGRFIVTDPDNYRVQVFNSDGTVARIIATRGTVVGQVKDPCGVVVDGAGRIIVVEGGENHRIQVF